MVAPSLVRLVSRKSALAKQTHHQLVPGLGYLPHAGPPDLPPDAIGNKNCKPPLNTADGSEHILQPAGGHPPMKMTWVAAESAWASMKPGKGNRMAWTCDHLSKAGWEYLSPAPPPVPSSKGKAKRA